MSAITRRKGKLLVRYAKALFEAQGALVEVAPLQSRYITGGKVVMLAADYFHCWDLILAWPDGRRGFVQVTTWNHAPERRRKILTKQFPCTQEDFILGYKAGSGRCWRVLKGPAFLTATSETWEIVESNEEPEDMSEDAQLIRAAEC